MQERDLLTTPEAAGYLKLSTRTLERYRQQEKGPPWVKLIHRVYYEKNDLFHWMRQNKRLY